MQSHLGRDNLTDSWDFVIAPDDLKFSSGAGLLLQMAPDGTWMDETGKWVGTFGYDVEDSWCRTGLATKLVHINDKGKATNVTLKGDRGEYDLTAPQGNNKFRMFVQTLSGSDEGDNPWFAGAWDSDALGTQENVIGEFRGRSDRVTVNIRQLNIPYFAALEAKVLSESENPQRLLRNPELLYQKTKELIDPNMVLALRRSNTWVTDQDGKGTWDFNIPDDWPPGPIFITVEYGYDADMEKSTGELNMEVLNTAAIFVQIGLEIAFYFLCPPCGLLRAAYFLLVDLPEIMQMFANVPLGVKNKYGCSFSPETPCMAAYQIEYKGSEQKVYEDMDAGAQDFMAQLVKDEEVRKNNMMMSLGVVGAAIVLVAGFWLAAGGK